jgi:hypothetical protein
VGTQLYHILTERRSRTSLVVIDRGGPAIRNGYRSNELQPSTDKFDLVQGPMFTSWAKLGLQNDSEQCER